MDTLAALPTGTKLVLAASALLVLDLFLTWQTIDLEYGGGARVATALDGWDFWGLLMGLGAVLLIVVVLVRRTGSGLLSDGRWELVPLGLATLVLLFAVVKTARDDGSEWASYLGLALAALALVGSLLDWRRTRPDDEALTSRGGRPMPASQADTTGVAAEPEDRRARW